MHQTLRVVLLLVIGGGAVTLLAAAAVYWLEPSRRVVRGLRRALRGPLDAEATAPVRGQGVGLRLDADRLAVMRDLRDPGLVFELAELLGAELIFDGQVVARAFRGEPRKPLDHIDPQVARVTLRLVFDDVRDPEFELELWRADDPPRPAWDGPAAVQAARRLFTRLEAVVRR